MKVKFLVILFLLQIGCAFSQNKDILAPSPTASSLGKYIDNPVSYHAGTPNIQVPLYSIKLKEFTLPISLSYNPQDIQVNTTPSNVGLGWSLNAGGVITRVVQNFPDDYRQDQCNPNTDYDQGHYDTLQGDFPYCPWGYMYAIQEGEPLIQANNGYYGTPTYNLDLDAIYTNRATLRPDRAIIGNFAYPVWADTSSDFDGINRSDYIPREINTMKMYADLEPDIFYFNFNGYSGKFVFDVENGFPRIKTIPYQDLDITYETDQTSGKLIGFKIIDQNGNQYFFQDYEYTAQIENYFQNGIMRRTTYNSSWWLTKIITAGGDYLNFSYQDEKLVSFSFTAIPRLEVLASVYNILPNQSPVSALNGPGYVTKTLTDTKRLTSVYNNTIQVNFQAEHNRTDLQEESTSKAITGVEINYKNATEGLDRIKKYKLEYDYFLADPTEPQAYAQPSFSDQHHKKRLRLKSVQEHGKTDVNVLPKCSFEYNYYDYTGNSTLKFPSRYTNNLDLWGYANGANNTTLIPKLHIYPDYYEKGDLRMYSVYEKSNYSGKHFTTLGGNRLPNINYGTIGVLNKIVYPTGGNTFYEYEAHRFLMDGEEYEGGGLRIKKIIKDDGEGKKIIYNYRYTKSISNNTTSGKIVSIPLFANFPSGIDFTHTQSQIDKHPGAYYYNDILSTEVNRYRMLAGFCSSPVNALGSSSNLGYTKVIEFMTESVNSQNYDNGRTEYTFSFPAALGDKNDILNGDCTLDENGICDGLYRTTRIHNFFMYGYSRTEGNWDFYPESSLSHLTPPNPNYEWARGQLLKEAFYNSTGSLVKENLYTYKNYFPKNQISPTKVYGFRMSEFYPYASFSDSNSARYAFRVAKYEILTDVAKVLSLKTEIQYANTGSGTITTTNAYAYEGSSHKNITKTTTNTSTSDELMTTYKYPLDYSINAGPQEGMYALRNKKISAIPIEITGYTIKGGTQLLTGSLLNTYSLVNNIALPTRSFKLETGLPVSDFQPSTIAAGPGFFTKDSRYVEKVKYNRYDTAGNILEIEDKTTGLTTTYVWGYNNQYPIAKVVNATYDDIISVLNLTNLTKLNNGYKEVVITPGPPKVIIQKVILTDAEIRSLLSPLRTNLVNAQVTIFTHKPLVGITSETDTKGVTTYYEYDDLNRLNVVKDHNGNILGNNVYNYKN